MQRILAGMRVVEVSAFIAAPLGGMTLAQLGADVIRIDPLEGGLDHRRWPVTEDDVSLFWCGMNKAKRSVAINTATPQGRELVAAIVCAPGEDAGMFLSNFPPTGWRSYESLSRRRPDLIQLTLQGDRHGGSAIDPTVNCATGLPLITGLADAGVPVNHVLPAWDLITGQMMATAILAAERHRRRTGEGQHVRVSLEDVAFATMGNLGFIAEAMLGGERERHGNHVFGTLGRDFACGDGERVMVVGVTLKQWQAICDATGTHAQMQAIERARGVSFEREGDRFRAREDICAVIARWVGARTLAEVREAFDAKGVCWGRYATVNEMVASNPSCSTENPMFSRIEQPGVGPLLVPGHPLSFDRAAANDAQPAPTLGQHTEEVLAQLLGLSTAAIGQLNDQRVIALS